MLTTTYLGEKKVGASCVLITSVFMKLLLMYTLSLRPKLRHSIRGISCRGIASIFTVMLNTRYAVLLYRKLRDFFPLFFVLFGVFGGLHPKSLPDFMKTFTTATIDFVNRFFGVLNLCHNSFSLLLHFFGETCCICSYMLDTKGCGPVSIAILGPILLAWINFTTGIGK